MEEQIIRKLLLLLAFALFITACNVTTEPDYDILTEGEDIPLVLTQANGVHDRLQKGLAVQSLDKLHLSTVQAVDFRGKPFVDITISSPEPISDNLWDFLNGLTGDEWDVDDMSTPWTTTFTGATTVRDVLITSHEGLFVMKELAQTVDKLGGSRTSKVLLQ